MADLRPRAVVLDLFDTLVRWSPQLLPEMEVDGRRVRSTIPLLAATLERVLARPFRVEEFMPVYLGVIEEIEAARRAAYVEISCHERFRRTLQRLGVENGTVDFAEVLTREHMAAVRAVTSAPPENVAAVRAMAPNVRLGVLSNFDDTRTGHEVVEDTGVRDAFEVVIISAELELRKPHPEIFRAMLGRLSLRPDEILFVGDNPREDVAGARGMGIPVAWVIGQQKEFPPGLPEPDYRIAGIAELPALLGLAS